MPKSDHPKKAVTPYERPKAFQSTVEIVEMEEKTFYGEWKKSSKKTVRTDRAELYKKHDKDFEVVQLPYIVLVQNYSKKKEFELFVDVGSGPISDLRGLDKVTLPAGEYARIIIEPKLVCLWEIIVKITPIKEYIKGFLWNLE